jgi:hypothetical protein
MIHCTAKSLEESHCVTVTSYESIYRTREILEVLSIVSSRASVRDR